MSISEDDYIRCLYFFIASEIARRFGRELYYNSLAGKYFNYGEWVGIFTLAEV